MSFRTQNAAYEDWLRTQCDVVERDLEYKHERMTKNSFIFLRATFFRWARRIETLCPELRNAPPVLSVGDTHTENFGTWRDTEGRLVWGVNDFDEAAIIPYPFDLVRLATSVRLAPDIDIPNRDAAAAILDGYRSGLDRPRPTLLVSRKRGCGLTWLALTMTAASSGRKWTAIPTPPRPRTWQTT